MLAFAYGLHAAFPRDPGELSVVALGERVDRLLAAGDTPQQKPAQRRRMTQRVTNCQPRARRGAPDIHWERAKLASEFMQIVGPDLVLGSRAVERHLRGAAVAPVMQQHAIAVRGDAFREIGQLVVSAPRPQASVR